MIKLFGNGRWIILDGDMTTISSDSTDANINHLKGGERYIFNNPLTSLVISRVEDSSKESEVLFTVGDPSTSSDTTPTIVAFIPSDCRNVGEEGDTLLTPYAFKLTNPDAEGTGEALYRTETFNIYYADNRVGTAYLEMSPNGSLIGPTYVTYFETIVNDDDTTTTKEYVLFEIGENVTPGQVTTQSLIDIISGTSSSEREPYVQGIDNVPGFAGSSTLMGVLDLNETVEFTCSIPLSIKLIGNNQLQFTPGSTYLMSIKDSIMVIGTVVSQS